MKRISHRSRQYSFAFHIYKIFCGFDLHHLVFMSIFDSWSKLFVARSFVCWHTRTKFHRKFLWFVHNKFIHIGWSQILRRKTFSEHQYTHTHTIDACEHNKVLETGCYKHTHKMPTYRIKKNRQIFKYLYEVNYNTKSILFRNRPHFPLLNTLTDYYTHHPKEFH